MISRMSLAADWGSAVAPEESEFGVAVCSALTFSCGVCGSWVILIVMPAFVNGHRVPDKPDKYTVDICPVCNGRGTVQRQILRGEKVCGTCDGLGNTWFWWIGQHRRMGPVSTPELRQALDQHHPGAR